MQVKAFIEDYSKIKNKVDNIKKKIVADPEAAKIRVKMKAIMDRTAKEKNRLRGAEVSHKRIQARHDEVLGCRLRA